MENGKKIEKIIESMNEIPDSTLVSKKDSSHEYEFINENVGGGLIFEYGTPIETDDNSAASDKAEESVSAVDTSESDQSKKSDREEEIFIFVNMIFFKTIITLFGDLESCFKSL